MTLLEKTARFKELEAFVRRIAELPKDGEEILIVEQVGGEFVLENDDAVDRLHALIDEARDLTTKEQA